MLILVPAIWAVYIQVLVRRSPPGAAITVAMGDILAAMDQVPRVNPEDQPFFIAYDLRVGDSWIYHIKVTPRKGGDDILGIVGYQWAPLVTDVSVPPGSYRAKVLSKDKDKWLLEIRAVKGGALPEPFFCTIDSQGNLSTARNTVANKDVRDDLFRRTGILLPGPFAKELRPHDWCGGLPGTTLSVRSRNMVKNLKLELGRDRMPPRGGLMFMGPATDVSNEWVFKILSYRRLPLERDSWEGFIELLVRADYRCPTGRVHLIEGIARFRDLVDLQKDRKIGALGEYSVVIHQSVEVTNGGK